MKSTSQSSSSQDHQNHNLTQINKYQQDNFLHLPKIRNEFVKILSDFFNRDLISIPLINIYPHQHLTQRCGLRAATLELDTAAYPNIEYIAGNRLSVYPVNPIDHVQLIMKHLIDDISQYSQQKSVKKTVASSTSSPPKQTTKTPTTPIVNNKHFNSGIDKTIALGLPQASGSKTNIKSNLPLAELISLNIPSDNNNDSVLRLAISYLYDITSAPSRDLLKLMADCCTNKEHKNRLLFLSKNDQNWENWICQNLRTLKSTFEEFNSCSISAKRLLNELAPLKPRQYSISSIKSAQRFRTEIIVIQHKFNTNKQKMNILLQNQSKQFEGLCSNYLLSLKANDFIVCEFVENPRFTLKGNRERPIMMIGQDVGCIAFRPFWQQRALEYDRAQIFYTLFKDLQVKKFGDMQLVCLTGNKCKIEDLFKREINSILTHKIISSASYIDRKHLLDQAIDEDKGLLELGQKIVKLLIEQNGCLYTCCDPQMTQAIELLLVKCIEKNQKSKSIEKHQKSGSLSRDKVMMALLPKWKGKKEQKIVDDNKYTLKLENPFEKTQIVQEIYDPSI